MKNILILKTPHIEVLFSAIRGHGRSNNNPTSKQFESMYKRLLTNIEIKGSKFGIQSSILNVSSVITSKRKENLEESSKFQIMLDSFDQTYLQLFHCLGLTGFTEDVVSYIAGFVAKCIKRCLVCIYYLNL